MIKKETKITGVIKLVRKGGFLPLPDQPDQEIFIPFNDTWPAFDRDTVTVELTGHKTPEGKLIGRVDKVLERAFTEVVGTLSRENGQLILSPDHERLPAFSLKPNRLKPMANYKAIGRFLAWPDKNNLPEMELVKLLGPVGANETEMQAIVASRGFIPEFPAAVEAEAKKLKKNFLLDLESEAKIRRDFRPVPTCTIDPVDAKDFDDALSIRQVSPGRYEVGVHIADVSHYVRPGTALDDEAKKRATSIYLVDRTIPMLPEVLSNDVCSLVPHQDRLTFGAVFELDDEGKILSEWFGRTVIHSDRRFSYEEAQEVLDSKRTEFSWEIKTLNRLAEKLRQQKIEAGAISFEDEEIKFVLDAAGRPLKVVKKIRTASHLLIEDFMLLANKKVAEYASRYNEHRPHTFVYRIHDWPNLQKMAGLVNFLKPLGYELKLKDNKIASQDLNRLLAQAEEKAESHIINRAAIRAMAKAIYSTENIGHWGLAFPYYTHFTSPIRRYPDLLVHRLLAIFLNKKKPAQKMLDEIAAEVIRSSAREADAAEAERESVKLKQVEYMAGHLGEKYEGIISGVTEFGFFVEENDTKAEGLIALRDLSDDFYTYDKPTLSLIGQKTKKRFRLGDRVKFKIKAADPRRRRLDLKLI